MIIDSSSGQTERFWKRKKNNVMLKTSNWEAIPMCINWWMDKTGLSILWNIFYLAINRNETLLHTKTWMNLKNTMLIQRNKKQVNMIPFYMNFYFLFKGKR